MVCYVDTAADRLAVAHLEGRVVGQRRAGRERLVAAATAAVRWHVLPLWLRWQPRTQRAGGPMGSRGGATRGAQVPQRLHCNVRMEGQQAA